MAELQHAIRLATIHATAQGQGRRGAIPVPVRGWNTRDNVSNMHPETASELLNFFPDRGRISSRRGFVEYADTEDSEPIETIHQHLNGSVSKLFAISDSAVYNITDPEAVVADVDSGITEGRWRAVTLNGNSIFVNGVDVPLRHDESGDWVAHGFTGIGRSGKARPGNRLQEPAFLH